MRKLVARANVDNKNKDGGNLRKAYVNKDQEPAAPAK